MCLEVGFASAQSSIGIVISMQGQVAAVNQTNQKRSLQRGASVYLYDKIVTEQDSKAQVRLNDDSVIVIQPSSEFYVSEFSFNKSAPRNNKYVGNIVKGMLINISGQGDTKNYQLNSPLATIAFRGTGLATKLISKNNALINQEIHVFDGYVIVSNRCENVIGIERGQCISEHITIGAGQQVNSATINRVGKIQSFKSEGSLSQGNIDGMAGKIITRKGEGGITITCKGK